jgi:hypothetical protein
MCRLTIYADQGLHIDLHGVDPRLVSHKATPGLVSERKV